MQVKEINSEIEWEDFVSRQDQATVLQSWSWRSYLEADGSPTKALAVIKDDKILAASLVSRLRLPQNKFYLYSSRGPIFGDGLDSEQKIESLIALRDYLVKTDWGQPIFWHVDPALTQEQLSLEEAGFKKTAKHVQPGQTIIVDLKPSEDEIFSSFKPKTRYNIRLAEKKGITISEVGVVGVDKFFDLLKATALRDGFRTSPKEHYRNIFEALGPERGKLYLAEYGGKVIAGLTMTQYGKEAIYLHGASDYEHRNLMAPYLLQWQAMRQAKAAGAESYDLWGVAPESEPEHSWSGITRFKRGFSDRYIEYVGGYDYVYQGLWYKMFNIARILRRLVKF